MLIFAHPFGLSLQLYRVTLRVSSRPFVMKIFQYCRIIAVILLPIYTLYK